jgi:hypothetical protein
MLELTLMLMAAIAALFFYKSAEEKEKEKERLSKELRRVRQDGGGAAGGDKCTVCAGNPIEVLIEPCGHVAVCRECVQRMHRKEMTETDTKQD